MFLAGFVITVAMFFAVLEIPFVVNVIQKALEEEEVVDLDIKPKDDRDLIAAAEKLQKEVKEAEKLNKVEESIELKPEEEIETEKKDEELEKTEEEPPVNLNDDDPETQRIVEELPKFPGGMVEYMKWLTANLSYPPAGRQLKVEGRVVVSFIVETDGTISNLQIEQHSKPFFDNEAMRVMRLMPNWEPGKDHGKVCRTKVAVPVVFAL